MYAVIKWLYLTALIVWVGEVVFLSFVVAPSLFRALPTPEAGSAVSAIFPIYYRVGYVCGAVLVFTSLALLAGASARAGWIVTSLLAVAMLSATLYAGVVIQPRAGALRPLIHEATAPESVKHEFSRLHRMAVQLNGAVLVCGVVVSMITATALRP
jgi:uncharacterized membrane protein